jgi:two-component system, NarL family, response regulator DegU
LRRPEHLDKPILARTESRYTSTEGIGNREIAEQLGIKESTVKKSLLRTYDKLGVSNRVELVLYALTHRGAEKSAPRQANRHFHRAFRWNPSTRIRSPAWARTVAAS